MFSISGNVNLGRMAQFFGHFVFQSFTFVPFSCATLSYFETHVYKLLTLYITLGNTLATFLLRLSIGLKFKSFQTHSQTSRSLLPVIIMGLDRKTNNCVATISSTLLFCAVIVLICTLIPIQAFTTGTTRSLFARGKYLSSQHTVELAQFGRDYQIYDSTIVDSTTISMSVDGTFGPNTNVYMYVSPTFTETCSDSYCHYPGTWFVLPIDEASHSESDDFDFNWTGSHFRSAFATLNQAWGTPPSYGIYPPSFTIDFIVPLDAFTNNNPDEQLTWSFSTKIESQNPLLDEPFSFSLFSFSKDASQYASTDQWYNYLGFGLKLKALSQGGTLSTLDMDLMSIKKGDFQSSSIMEFALLGVSASHKLFFGSSSTSCTFSASSSLKNFFWDISLNPGLAYPSIYMLTWTYDAWPRRLSINCPNSAYYTTPGWFYVWQNGTTKRVIHPTQSTSSWSVVETNVRTNTPIHILSSNENSIQSPQNSQLTTLQTNTDPTVPQTMTQFASSALIHNTQTFFALAAISSSVTSPNIFEASSRVDNTGSDDVSVGAIIGIVVGCIAGLVILILLIVLCCLCCRSSPSDSNKKSKTDTVQMGLAQPHQAVQVATYTTTTMAPAPIQSQPQPDYQHQYYSQNQSFGQPQPVPYGYSPQNQHQQQYPPQQQQHYGQPQQSQQQSQQQPQYQPQQQPQQQFQPQPQYDAQPAPKEELPPAYDE